jgi:hypothetical protein
MPRDASLILRMNLVAYSYVLEKLVKGFKLNVAKALIVSITCGRDMSVCE